MELFENEKHVYIAFGVVSLIFWFIIHQWRRTVRLTDEVIHRSITEDYHRTLEVIKHTETKTTKWKVILAFTERWRGLAPQQLLEKYARDLNAITYSDGTNIDYRKNEKVNDTTTNRNS